MANAPPGHVPVMQHWSPTQIILSYLISVTGSYCTIQLMEQWRRAIHLKKKMGLLALSSFALGGCGIWCTHFAGMNALELTLADGTILELSFELGMTIVSFIFPVLGVFIGLYIASKDPFFLEMHQARRKEMLAEQLKHAKMSTVVKKGEVVRQIKITALFSRLWRIVFGATFAALGVLGMHYLGMIAQRTNASMEFNAGVVVVSCFIAYFTATAAFWILFRALTFMPTSEPLRMASALIMGVAVCGTHYCGMGSASYTQTGENFLDETRFIIDGDKASACASHGALFCCYWMLTFSIADSVRKAETLISIVATQGKQHDRSSHAPNPTQPHTNAPPRSIRRNSNPHLLTTQQQHSGHSVNPKISKIYVAASPSVQQASVREKEDSIPSEQLIDIPASVPDLLA